MFYANNRFLCETRDSIQTKINLKPGLGILHIPTLPSKNNSSHPYASGVTRFHLFHALYLTVICVEYFFGLKQDDEFDELTNELINQPCAFNKIFTDKLFLPPKDELLFRELTNNPEILFNKNITPDYVADIFIHTAQAIARSLINIKTPKSVYCFGSEKINFLILKTVWGMFSDKLTENVHKTNFYATAKQLDNLITITQLKNWHPDNPTLH